MSESIKSISKIYLFIIIIGYLLFGGVNTRILFNMILILNSCIAICCFLVTVSNFDLNKDKIYKQIAMLFTIKGIMNIVGGFSILTNLNKPIDLNKDLQIYVLATTIEVILLILITKSKKIELNINKIINICLISTSIGVLLIYNTTIFPKLYTKKGVTILFYVITFTFILGLLYALKNFKNILKAKKARPI